MSRYRREQRRAAVATWSGALMALGGLAGAVTLGYAVWVEPDWIEVKDVRLTLPRLPRAFHGYKLVQISDLHAGKFMPDERLSRVVDLVNGQEPDLVAMTGDFVTRVYRGAPKDIIPAMSSLMSKDGVVAILGNHDYWGGKGPDLMRQVIAASGLIDLNNKVHTLERDGERLHVAGIDSVREGNNRLDLVLKELPRDGAAILLAHEPDFADVAARTRRFDLQISGHAHGGQVVIPGIGSPALPVLGRKYWRGHYIVEEMHLYVNRGLGMVRLPFRFLARPEITVYTLEAQENLEDGR
ncbi:MAG: metallophosphoesterase [Chloroflexota bacterium]|nr:metallophosphoesterase [Chloroflexota bacterium]MDQ5867401.1 metallophosphoesterase [Chloroflexota bacterium]